MVTLTHDVIHTYIPERFSESNKGSYGSILNIAGSVNYRGAAYLSSMSALAIGAGYVTLACSESVADTVAGLTPNLITVPLPATDGCIAKRAIRVIRNILGKYTVVSIGCGLSNIYGISRSLQMFFLQMLSLLCEQRIPTVVDADGLNILSSLKDVQLPERVILTPHPGELSRLLHIDVASIQSDRVRYATEAARHFSAVVVLKGHRTVITDGDAVYINETGNSALAKAGTGDVLTGMTAGLCAQGLSPLQAACAAVYLHGMAGELAASELTEYGVCASDLMRYIPLVIRTVL